MIGSTDERIGNSTQDHPKARVYTKFPEQSIGPIVLGWTVALEPGEVLDSGPRRRARVARERGVGSFRWSGRNARG